MNGVFQGVMRPATPIGLRLPAGHLEGVVALRDDQVGEEPEVLRRALRLSECLGDRQARVERLQLGEPLVLGFDRVGDAIEDACPLARQQARPRTGVERPLRGGDREVDVGLLAGRCGRIDLVRHGVENVEGGAVDAVDERSADVMLDARGQTRGGVARGHRQFAPIWKPSVGVR
jgi:hypothetical protein